MPPRAMAGLIDSLGSVLIAVVNASRKGPTWATGTKPSCLAVDPLDRFVYVSADDGIWTYVLLPGGGLSLLASSVVGTGVGQGCVAADLTGHYVFLTQDGTNTVSVFGVDASGNLTHKGTYPTGGSTPNKMSITK